MSGSDCTKDGSGFSYGQPTAWGIRLSSAFLLPLRYSRRYRLRFALPLQASHTFSHSYLIHGNNRRCPKAMHESCMPRKIRDNPTRIWKAAVSKDGRLLEFTQVSENFFYCENHQTQNMMQGPVHDAPLFSETLWKKWRTAYALKFRCLKSSEPYIPERNRRCLGEDLSVALAALNVQRDSSKSFENEALRIAQKKRMRPQNRKSEEELRSAFQAVLDREEDQSTPHVHFHVSSHLLS